VCSEGLWDDGCGEDDRNLWSASGITDGFGGIGILRKGDERKALLATVLRSRTTVGFDWIAKRLSMGHPGSVSRQVGKVKRNRKLKKRTLELEQMLQCED
jgi:hypothetical protein